MIEGAQRYGSEEVTDLLNHAAAPLAQLTTGSLCRIGGKDLLDLAGQLEHVARLVFSAQVFVADELHAQNVAQLMGASSTATLLAQHLLIAPRQARLRVAAAKQTLSQDSMTGGELEPVLPELGDAIRDGLNQPRAGGVDRRRHDRAAGRGGCRDQSAG